MIYTKPTVEVLDEAVTVIQGNKPDVTVTDSFNGIQAAYDLDE